MFNWIRELLEIRNQYRICKSCETLNHQLELANYEKEQLLRKLLKEPESVMPEPAPVKITRPVSVPWHIKRQMLEQEDRERARVMRDAPKPDSTNQAHKDSVADLEKELGIVENARSLESQ